MSRRCKGRCRLCDLFDSPWLLSLLVFLLCCGVALFCADVAWTATP